MHVECPLDVRGDPKENKGEEPGEMGQSAQFGPVTSVRTLFRPIWAGASPAAPQEPACWGAVMMQKNSPQITGLIRLIRWHGDTPARNGASVTFLSLKSRQNG